MLENIRLSFRGILSHKLRSFLTMLGIIIGIAAIIAIVSTIKGTNDQIQKNLIGSGDNIVTVTIKQSDWDYDMSEGIPNGFTQVSDDTLEELRNIEHVEGVSLYVSREEYEGIYHLSQSIQGGYLYGIDETYFSNAGYVVKQGRGISASDNKNFRRVAVLDTNAAQELFLGEDCIGKTIEIKGTPYEIVGIVTEKDTYEPVINSLDDYYMYHSSSAGKVYITISTWPVIYQYDEPENVILKADETDNMTQIGKSAENILNASLNTSDDSSISYQAQDLLEQAKQIQQLSQSTNTMLIWIAGISLLVGGIGVMNIMLVSVTERTSEIGLKKAIGAKKKAIMRQFLTEAVVLTSIGGILGVLVGILLAYIISKLNSSPMAISIPATIFAVIFSMLIGIIFGLIPSYKAANLDPIDALRHE